MTKQIKAVVFDLGKVLVNFSWEPAIRRMAPHTSVPADKIIPRVFEVGRVYDYEEGRIGTQEFFDSVRKALDTDADQELLEKYYTEIFTRRPDMEKLFADVQKCVPVAILSDTSPIHWQYMTGFAPAVSKPDFLAVSYEIGTRKPQEKAYRYVCDGLGVAPEETLFFDDKDFNIEGARKAGMNGFVYENEPATRKTIASYIPKIASS